MANISPSRPGEYPRITGMREVINAILYLDVWAANSEPYGMSFRPGSRCKRKKWRHISRRTVSPVSGIWTGQWEYGPVISVEVEVIYTRKDGTKTDALPATSTLLHPQKSST
ncbi:MAG TPA: hypothetical protein VF043_03430 [Ktedonobacteraceae bacterium]